MKLTIKEEFSFFFFHYKTFYFNLRVKIDLTFHYCKKRTSLLLLLLTNDIFHAYRAKN